MTPMVQKGMLIVVGPSVPLASTGLARRLFSNCDQIVLKKQQEFNGFAMGLCLLHTAVPFFTQVDTTPDYFANTTEKVTTDSFYWTNRIIAGLADAHYSHHVGDLEDYQERTMALGHARIGRVDQAFGGRGNR